MSHEKSGLISAVSGSLFPTKSMKESYQKAIGALAISFSRLHFLLEDFSREVFAISNETASILLKDLPVTRLIEKLRACAENRIPRESDRKEFKSILKKAADSSEKRNELLHALWIIMEGQPVFCYKRRGNQSKSEAPSIGEINALTRSIIQLTNDLIEFTERQTLADSVGLALAPLQRNQPNP